jgi:hypothetical protein
MHPTKGDRERLNEVKGSVFRGGPAKANANLLIFLKRSSVEYGGLGQWTLSRPFIPKRTMGMQITESTGAGMERPTTCTCSSGISRREFVEKLRRAAIFAAPIMATISMTTPKASAY